MSGVKAKLGKLKGRSLGELRERGRQALGALTERSGLSAATRLPSDAAFRKLLDETLLGGKTFSPAELLAHFQRRATPKFFAAFDEPETACAELRKRFEPERAALIEKAERLQDGRFDLLGLKNLSFGAPVDWHREPVAGKRSPLAHWSLIEELDREASGDKKIVWELNRHQHFVTLGRAYWLTGDERYAETFAAQLAGWMEANPPKLGLNWLSSLEIAFRSISWLWALHFFRDSKHLTPELYARTLKFLYLKARHLESYLSTYSSPNTHLTGEALGLFYLGTMLPSFRRAARWREKGSRILLAELERHVLSDGVYFERTSYYHRYTTDFYTHFLLLSERHGLPVPARVREKLSALLDHLLYLTKPDGTTPLVGDDDGGRLMMLDEREARDFRATLATGAAIFGRADYKYVSGEAAEETFWLLGGDGIARFDELASQAPAHLSQSFPAGGYYVMRDGWDAGANYLLLDCGPHGALGCGHAHADALSFELAARGRTLLVDPGTYTYTGEPLLRDYFRSSRAHNALVIDGESSSVPRGPFSWEHVAEATAGAWLSLERFDYFAGSHDGYLRLQGAPAGHTREVLFLKKDYWVLRDCVETTGEHQYELCFHFAPGEHPVDGGLQLFSFGAAGDWRTEEGFSSSCYAARSSSTVRVFAAAGRGPQEFFSLLLPREAQTQEARVVEMEATGGRAFEVRGAASLDVLLAGDGHLVEAFGLATDFKWCWARFDRAGTLLEELVLLDGRRLTFQGRELLCLTQPAAYAVARRRGDKLCFEIDGEVGELDSPVCEPVAVASTGHPTDI